MTIATRMTLILMLVFSITAGLSAQETTTAADTAAETTTTVTDTDTATERDTRATETGEPQGSYEIRNKFSRLLHRSPSELGTILALDPTLLSNEAYLTGYPELAKFVAQYPEVRRNPRFYLVDFRVDRRGGLDEVIEELMVFLGFALTAFALAWLVRAIIEQKRWNRLSRTQSEVHNKILDRFSTSGELLDYIKTPAGTKFLESAPIPLHADQSAQNTPLTRIMWSIQIGVIVAAGALGMLLVSGRADKDSAEGLFAMGVIGFAIGAGFIASALISLVMSRRMGLLKTAADESEAVR